jgi:5-methylcytosine-specific restriction endonuclease McrBC GTP-binding regulatory subunit McrB
VVLAFCCPLLLASSEKANPKLKVDEVRRIAEDYARKEKINLEHYKPPVFEFISSGEKNVWHVDFTSKDELTIGDGFTLVVDDEAKKVVYRFAHL